MKNFAYPWVLSWARTSLKFNGGGFGFLHDGDIDEYCHLESNAVCVSFRSYPRSRTHTYDDELLPIVNAANPYGNGIDTFKINSLRSSAGIAIPSDIEMLMVLSCVYSIRGKQRTQLQ